MAKFLSKIQLQTAKQKKNKFAFDGITVNTTDFFRPLPIRTIPVFPDDVIDVNMQSLVRLQPLPVPTFGRVDATFRWFFVPYRSIMYRWKNFITNTPYKSSIIDTVTTTQNYEIVKAIVGDIIDQNTISVGDMNPFVQVTYVGAAGTSTLVGNDFQLSINSQDVCFKFRPRGQHLYSILLSLGYGINFSSTDSTDMSLLPLLAYFRVYLDYYLDPQVYTAFENYFDNWFESIPVSNHYLYLYEMFKHITHTNYDFDYFTSAWKSPVAPDTPSGIDTPRIVDITMTPNTISSTNTQTVVGDNTNYPGRTPGIQAYSNSTLSTNGNIRTISQYAIDALRAVTNYSKRHNLVGWRVMDRFLADFGKKLDYKEANQSIFLSSSTMPVQISTIYSNSDTSAQSGTVLGAYAGSGVGADSDHLHFESDSQHGLLICISSIVPKISYYQGRCKQQGVLAIKPLDFFHGDFDQLGVQAISLQELWADAKTQGELQVGGQWNGTYNPNKIFGYSPRYCEWKTGYDTLAGSFRLNSQNLGSDSYHLFRQIFPSGGNYDLTQTFWQNLTSITPLFRQGSQEQYDRIFAYQNADADHFTCFHNFDIKVIRAAAQIGEQYMDLHDDYQEQRVEASRDGSMFN